MRFVIVTGMSGSGKSTALKFLEDAGFFCVDNLPIPFIDKFAELVFSGTDDTNLDKVAIGVDIRSGHFLDEIGMALDKQKQLGRKVEILFLDASDDVLLKRYKETRRNHPLNVEGSVNESIKCERNKLEFIKIRADYIIDTGTLLTKELKSEIDKIFVDNKSFKNLFINVVSFGFKYGIPNDADLVFDVRFMPNPFYVDKLKYMTGRDKEVQEYVMSSDASREFLDKLTDMIKFLVPNYVNEGKNQLVIAIGCTGGKHRSVTIAKLLYDALKEDESYGIKLIDRNIENE